MVGNIILHSNKLIHIIALDCTLSFSCDVTDLNSCLGSFASRSARLEDLA
jgi:hypothetical protein